MAGTTTIEWATHSWNPVTGCEEVSPGCDRCYAKTIAERFRGGKAFPVGFDLTLHPDRMAWPIKEKKPGKIFVNSMSDWLHKDIPDDFILQMFATMLKADWHIYQLLTKRPSRLLNTALMDKIMALIEDTTGNRAWPSHIWLGVTVESQEYVWRATKLWQAVGRVGIPFDTIVLFLSCEPLLSNIVIDLAGFAWLIAGSESGHGARPAQLDWFRHLRDDCQRAGVAFFLKQFARNGHKIPLPELDGRIWNEFPVMPQEVQP